MVWYLQKLTELKTLFDQHIQDIKKERQGYQDRKEYATNYPENALSIIIDAMDGRKTALPALRETSKAYDSGFLPFKITAAVVHGVQNFCYGTTPDLAEGANLTIEVLYQTLIRLLESKGRLPPTLYLQFDNCGHNKNQ